MRIARPVLVSVVVAGLAAACGGTAGTGTVASPFACPTGAPAGLPEHQQHGTSSQIVPGTQVSVTVCRYSRAPDSGLPTRLVQHGSGDPSALASMLDELRRPEPGAAYQCPGRNGDDYLSAFDDRRGRRLLVLADFSGCAFVTNGDRSAFGSPDLEARLRAIAGGP